MQLHFKTIITTLQTGFYLKLVYSYLYYFPGDAMTRPFLLLLTIASGMSVANVYYAQPLLDALAAEFSISHGAVGGIITATQAGSALALLCLVPLGDMYSRRTLLRAQLIALIGTLLLLAAAPTMSALLAGMLLTGLLGTAMTQSIIAYAAHIAPPDKRGGIVGTVQGGVVTGLLLARVVSGFVADLAGWRSVYLMSAALMGMLAIILWRLLPVTSKPAAPLRYTALLHSMYLLLRHDRTLQIRGTLALLIFAVFSMFWSAIVLPLHAEPYYLSYTTIGALGLIGVAGALAASPTGRLADKGYAEHATGTAFAILALSWAVLWWMQSAILLLVLGIVLLDVAVQTIHVLNQSLIFNTKSDNHSRLVSCYMLFYAVGSGIGAIVSTSLYARYGWSGVCIAGAVISVIGLIFWQRTRSDMAR